MTAFKPYLLDEIDVQTETRDSYFGLIADTETPQPELHGYEVTMSGRLVLPELKQRPEGAVQDMADYSRCSTGCGD